MKTLILTAAIVLASILSTASAAPEPSAAPKTERLILAIDATELSNYALKNGTPTNNLKSKQLGASTFIKQVDALSKKLKYVNKAFKRITSVRYGKRQKIRAKLGKTSLTLRYTRAL